MNPKQITFLVPLSEWREDRLRVRALKDKGRITKFVVQYEALIRGEWRVIVRYDNAHGFAHKDLLHWSGRIDKQPLVHMDFNMALTFAIQDLKMSWQWYRVGYEKEIQDEERSRGGR